MLQNQEIETWDRKKTERGKYLGNTTNKFYKTETQGSYSDNNSQAQTPSPEKAPAHTVFFPFRILAIKDKFVKLSESKVINIQCSRKVLNTLLESKDK